MAYTVKFKKGQKSYNKMGGSYPTAKKVNEKVKKLAKLVKSDLKCYTLNDTALLKCPPATAVDESNHMVVISAPGAGTTFEQRIGNSIQCTSCRINYTVEWDIYDPAGGASLTGQQARIIVFSCSDSPGVYPELFAEQFPDGLLDSRAGILSDAVLALPNRRLLQSKRFKIYYDKIHKYQVNNNNGMIQVQNGSVYFKYNKRVQFAGTNAGVSNISKNHLFLAYIVGEDGATNGPRIRYATQVRYYDI